MGPADEKDDTWILPFGWRWAFPASKNPLRCGRCRGTGSAIISREEDGQRDAMPCPRCRPQEALKFEPRRR